MIEVHHTPTGFIWTMIGFCGRTLVTSQNTHQTDLEAFSEAKAYRQKIWSLGELIDHKQYHHG